VVKPIRHVVHVAEMNEAESSELGPLLRQTAAAVTEVVEPEQVYTCLWSHAGGVPVHIHFVVQPITRSTIAQFDALGPDLQTAMFRDGTLPGTDDVDAICRRFRAIFGRDDETVR
jgi:galactose-1-phosphate uridylyltransferase